MQEAHSPYINRERTRKLANSKIYYVNAGQNFTDLLMYLKRMILTRSCYDTIPNYQEAKGGTGRSALVNIRRKALGHLMKVD